jgi:hypothetical protein
MRAHEKDFALADNASRTESDSEGPVVEIVPDGYEGVRFWVMLLMVWPSVCCAIGGGILIGGLVQGEKGLAPAGVFLLAVGLIQIVPFAVALHYWSKVRLAGYWMMVVLVCLGLLAAGVGIWLGTRPGWEYTGGPSGCTFVLVLFGLVINVWSKETYRFFRRIDGRCPVCRTGVLRKVKHGLDWACPNCRRTVLWRQARRLTVRCPQCGKRLRGATTGMIGDTAVCPGCRGEFEIVESRTPQRQFRAPRGLLHLLPIWYIPIWIVIAFLFDFPGARR